MTKCELNSLAQYGKQKFLLATYNVLDLPGSLCKHQCHVTVNSINFVEQKVVSKTSHVISKLIINSFSVST